MDRSIERLRDIFGRTDGRCHLCKRKLAFRNYGRTDVLSGWEIEHSVPRCNGGSDRLSNLYAAHISCNRSKGACSTRSFRAANGFSKAPLSTERRERAKSNNRWGWGAGVAALGGLLLGPAGVVIGGLAGACIGDSFDPEA